MIIDNLTNILPFFVSGFCCGMKSKKIQQQKTTIARKELWKKNYYVCILLHSEDQLILGHLKKGNSEFYEISKITNRKKTFL